MNKAVVEIKLGNVDGTPTVRATARKQSVEVDEFGIRRYVTGDILVQFDMNAEPLDRFQSMKWKRTPKGKWQPIGKKLNAGKIYFHALKRLKYELESKTTCKVCEKGTVFFRKLREGMYLATWNDLRFVESNVCQKCHDWFHPLKSEFNPRPEFDDDDEPYDNIWADSVNEPFTDNKERMLDDDNYMNALDIQETREFLGTGNSACVQILNPTRTERPQGIMVLCQQGGKSYNCMEG